MELLGQIIGPALGLLFAMVMGYFIFREKVAAKFAETPTRADLKDFQTSMIDELEKVSDRLTEQMKAIRSELLERHNEAIRRLDNHGAKIDTATTNAAIAKQLYSDLRDDLNRLQAEVARKDR